MYSNMPRELARLGEPEMVVVAVVDCVRGS